MGTVYYIQKYLYKQSIFCAAYFVDSHALDGGGGVYSLDEYQLYFWLDGQTFSYENAVSFFPSGNSVYKQKKMIAQEDGGTI